MSFSSILKGTFLLVGALSLINCSKAGVDFQDVAQVSSSSTSEEVSTPDTCDENGVTKASLLTASTKNQTAGNYIDYQISLADCAGWSMVLQNKPILFDLDAFIQGSYSLRYDVNDGNSIYSGELKHVSGSDLFGNQGSSFGHWATAPIPFTTSVRVVTLRIHLMGGKFIPNEEAYRGTTSITQDFYIKTFLRFGEAQPVTKKVLFQKP